MTDPQRVDALIEEEYRMARLLALRHALPAEIVAEIQSEAMQRAQVEISGGAPAAAQAPDPAPVPTPAPLTPYGAARQAALRMAGRVAK